MNTMELNKIAGAVLCGLLLISSVSFLGDLLSRPQELVENAYPIAVDESAVVEVVAEEPAGPEPILALLAAANIEAGAKLARKCSSCHAFEQGGKNGVGPALWNIVNAATASVAGYKYSPALAAIGGAWSYENLNAFLYRPKDYVPGTKMGFSGLRKTGERANLIAWMREQANDPAPLP